MPNVTLACQFCQTLNKIDTARFTNKPKCAECERPFLLDRPVKVLEESLGTAPYVSLSARPSARSQ